MSASWVANVVAICLYEFMLKCGYYHSHGSCKAMWKILLGSVCIVAVLQKNMSIDKGSVTVTGDFHNLCSMGLIATL
ncbi:MAG: hypothetical protein WCE81_11790 [Halobacteriota archaeon]